MASTTVSGSFVVDVDAINEAAYFMAYDTTLLGNSKMHKSIGGDAKGSSVQWPYYDPTAIATAASALSEANDFTNWRRLLNASVQVVASEFGTGIFMTDIVTEDNVSNVEAEIGRQLGISAARARELHILGAMSSGFTSGTVTGTNSTNGFMYSHYAKAHSELDGKILTVPGRKLVITHPYTWYYTAKSTFSETYGSAMGSVGEDVLAKYYKASIFGDVDIYTSNYITAATNATGYMWSADGLGYWEPRSIRIEQERNASARGDEFVCTLRGGSKVLVGGYGVRLLQYSTL